MAQNTYQLKFIVLTKDLYQDNRLSRLQLCIAGFINSYSGEKFYFTSQQMADMFNVTVDGIDKAIKKLVGYGYISKETVGKIHGGTFRVIHKSSTTSVLQYGSDYTSSVLQYGSPPDASTVHPRTAVRTKDNIKNNNKREFSEKSETKQPKPTYSGARDKWGNPIIVERAGQGFSAEDRARYLAPLKQRAAKS